MEEKQRQTYN